MPTDPPVLPVPTDDVEREVLGDIARYGWHVVIVRGGAHDHLGPDHEGAGPWSADPAAQAAYESDFTYTAGLSPTFAHPEIILVGSWQHAQAYLNVIGQMIQQGRRFQAGDTTEELLDGYSVRFDTVADHPRVDLLTWADWVARRRRFEALQLVLPDKNGLWPEDPHYDAFPQPSLS